MKNHQFDAQQKLYFPEKLVLFFYSKENKKPAGDILCNITFFASEKNNYEFQPELTDKNGITVVNKNDIEKMMRKMQEMWIMDYKSNLKDCFCKILLRIPSANEIEEGISNYLADESFRNIFEMQYGCLLNIEGIRKNKNNMFKPFETYINLAENNFEKEKLINIGLESPFLF